MYKKYEYRFNNYDKSKNNNSNIETFSTNIIEHNTQPEQPSENNEVIVETYFMTSGKMIMFIILIIVALLGIYYTYSKYRPLHAESEDLTDF